MAAPLAAQKGLLGLSPVGPRFAERPPILSKAGPDRFERISLDSLERLALTLLFINSIDETITEYFFVHGVVVRVV